jgi:flagellin
MSNGVQKQFTTGFVCSNVTNIYFTGLGSASNGLVLTFSGMNVKAGDKFTINLRASQVATGVNVEVKNSVAVTQSINWSFNYNGLNGQTSSWNFFSLESDGSIKDGTFGIEVGIMSNAITASGTTFTFAEGFGEVSSLDTQLKDIDRFYDPNGRFMVDNPQVITLVEGDGKTTSFSIFGTDTLDQIKDKLNTAIADGLGQGELVPTTAAENFVSYVTKADTVNVGSTQSMEGGFVIRSARAGQDGVVNIIADEGIVNALGLTTAQEAEDSGFTVTVADPLDPTKMVCQNLEISGNTLSAVIHPNIDVKFDSLSDMTTAWNTTVKSWDISDNAATSYITNIHIVDNTQIFQIGGTEGQNMGAAIGDMRLEALGIDNVQITDIESASKSVARLDTALSRISSQRATLGAVQNRLEYNISNLGVAGENLQASESRIRDADMAKEMMDFARLNILQQSTMAMLAQANQQPQQILQLLGW